MDLPFFWTPPAAGDGSAFRMAAGSMALSPDRPSHRGLDGNDNLQQPLVFERVFTAEQCAAIRELAARLPRWKGRSSSEDEEYRVCKTSWIDENAATAFVFDRLREAFHSANAYYGFEIAGFAEPLHYVVYPPGGRFEWHTDIGDGDTTTRKISLSVQLSAEDEYQGGDLEFCPHGVIEAFRGRGNAIAFPAYIPHRVHAVTSGVRHVLVAWIHGAAFR